MNRASFISFIILSGVLVISFTAFPNNTINNTQHITADSLDIELVDHHIHTFSPRDRQYLINEVEGLDSLPPLDIEKYREVMKSDNVEKATVLSNAYFFSKRDSTSEEDFKAVKSDNDLIARSVSKYPDEFIGFFSINPLSDSAFVEIERNANKEEFTGLKLQLANSEVDLRNKDHVRQLAEIFKKANSLDLAIVVHMRAQDNYGKKDAQIFIDDVLSEAPDSPVQIAHLSGWGGYDKQTDEALSVFAERISNNELRENIFFDLSAIIRPTGKADSSKGNNSDWYPQNRYDRVTEQLRTIGLERILFGTDWPDWSPAQYKSDIVDKLQLTEKELKIIFSNRAPWFK